MAETNNEKSIVTNPKTAAEEVTNPTNNNITSAARMLQHILSSRSLLIMRKTMILEALNQAEEEAEAKVEAALARKGNLKSDKAEVDKDNDTSKDSNKDNDNDSDNDKDKGKDKGKDNDNENPPSPPIPDRPVKSPSTVQVDEVNQAQAAIRSLQRHGASAQAAESPADVQQNLPAGNVPPMAPMAPMAPKATTSVITRSGRVVKPTREVRDMNQAADKKKTSTKAATRIKTRRRGGAKERIKGGAARSISAPPAATVNTTVTRSGRVVKPSLMAREMAGGQNKK